MDKWVYNYLIDLKALWEKEKLLITSNFSFSHNVFKSCLFLWCQNKYLWSKGLNLSPTLSQTSPGFYVSFENTVGKGEIAHNDCCLQTLSVWKSLKFVILERVNRVGKKIVGEQENYGHQNFYRLPTLF